MAIRIKFLFFWGLFFLALLFLRGIAISQYPEDLLNAYISGVCLLFILGLGVWIRAIFKGLEGLHQGLLRVAEGNFSQMLKIRGRSLGPLEALIRTYNQMLVCLEDRDQEFRRRQEKLVEVERLGTVGRLSATVVHEVRNPLNSMSLNLDWLEERLSEQQVSQEVRNTVASIAREVQRLNEIAERYLLQSKAEIPSEDRTDIHSLLREILAFDQADDLRRHILVEPEFANQAVVVSGKRSKLKQAFINVLKNAREAMPRGGKIRIRTGIEENVSFVEFQDNGTGASPWVQQQTFSPFFTTKQTGTGLGMTVAKQIVEENNGSLSFESSVGEGSTVRFQFPLSC